MDQGVLGSTFSPVSNYDGTSMTHTLTQAANSLVAGTTYTFIFSASNVVGDSSFSSEARFAAASPPSKPVAPYKDLAFSTKTSIMVRWAQSSMTEIPIQGYRLYMNDGSGAFTLVYDGSLNPLQRYYIVSGLITGNIYQLKVAAVNFNGES